MTDAKTLARKLAALTAKEAFQGKAMILCKSGHPAAMSYILQAIDGTMLLRDAVFSVGAHALTLRISGKRVIAVIDASAALKLPKDVLAQPLAADSTKALDHIHHALQTLTASDGLVLLERREADKGISVAGSGVGASVLSDLWDIPIEIEKPDPMTSFNQTCARLAKGMFVLNGDDVETVEGAASAIEVLQSLLEDDWNPFEEAHVKLTNDNTNKRLRILDGMGPEGQAVVCAEIEEKQCFALIPTEKTPALTRVWADIFLF